MAVTRNSFSIHWISSILLVGFSGLLYRFRSYKSTLVQISLHDTFSKLNYHPEWLKRASTIKSGELLKFKTPSD